ncbi:MAG: cupin domain-containing protein [Hyphomicrobiales bacterium]|nr:cupin domain-containing protein [Hyphomicrobiales bacterium]
MARVFALKDAANLSLPGRNSREIVAAASGAQKSTVRFVEIDPDKTGPRRGPHVHFDFEECIHVLSGQAVMRTDAGEYLLTAGDTILIPAGENHATYNTGDAVLTLLCFFPTNDVSAGTVEYDSWEAIDGN